MLKTGDVWELRKGWLYCQIVGQYNIKFILIVQYLDHVCWYVSSINSPESHLGLGKTALSFSVYWELGMTVALSFLSTNPIGMDAIELMKAKAWLCHDTKWITGAAF